MTESIIKPKKVALKKAKSELLDYSEGYMNGITNGPLAKHAKPAWLSGHAQGAKTRAYHLSRLREKKQEQAAE